MSLRRSLAPSITFSVNGDISVREKTMDHAMNDNNPLSGVTVLVVEDDVFLAMALEDTLVGMGAFVVEVCHILTRRWRRLTPTTLQWRFLILVSGRIR
jgi:hypothetical protein